MDTENIEKRLREINGACEQSSEIASILAAQLVTIEANQQVILSCLRKLMIKSGMTEAQVQQAQDQIFRGSYSIVHAKLKANLAPLGLSLPDPPPSRTGLN